VAPEVVISNYKKGGFVPAKNRIKFYAPGSYYHVYNRGVEKRIIFQDEQDYNVFFSYLKTYLMKKDIDCLENVICDENSSPEQKNRAKKEIHLNNFFGKIDLLIFCLMPNHFHFLLKQNAIDDMDLFMNSICTRYSMYFNRKNGRVGPLFQGVYKAVMVSNNEQMIYLSRYIHRNPVGLPQISRLDQYRFSSYPDYLSKNKNKIIDASKIMELFDNNREYYKDFVEKELSVEQEINNHSVDFTYIDK